MEFQGTFLFFLNFLIYMQTFAIEVVVRFAYTLPFLDPAFWDYTEYVVISMQKYVRDTKISHYNDRLFTKSDVANTVMKKAPSFCNVYIVSKGKISSTRMASHPLKRKSSNPSICIPPQRNSNFDATNLM